MKQIGNTKYYVTEKGEVINSKTNRKLKPQNNGNGYLKVTLTIAGIQIQRNIHRLVAEMYVVKISGKNQVNHIDGNKSNNHFVNLEWVTNSENQLHAHRIGLKQNGDKLYNAKFSPKQLNEIFEMSKIGKKRYLIAEEMGCAKSTISDILNGKRYKFALTGTELTLTEKPTK